MLDNFWTNHGSPCPISVQAQMCWTMSWQTLYFCWTAYGHTLYMDRHWTECWQTLDIYWISCPIFVQPHFSKEHPKLGFILTEGDFADRIASPRLRVHEWHRFSRRKRQVFRTDKGDLWYLWSTDRMSYKSEKHFTNSLKRCPSISMQCMRTSHPYTLAQKMHILNCSLSVGVAICNSHRLTDMQ